MNPFDRLWTETDYDKLREWYLAGLDIRDIAIRLGRTESAVRQKACVFLGLRRPRKIIKRRAENRKEYLDCIPNPFRCRFLKRKGFDINYYRTV